MTYEVMVCGWSVTSNCESIGHPAPQCARLSLRGCWPYAPRAPASCWDRYGVGEQALGFQVAPESRRHGVRIAFMFRSRSHAAQDTEATAGAPSENWRAATAIDTPWLSQTRSIRATLSRISGGAGR